MVHVYRCTSCLKLTCFFLQTHLLHTTYLYRKKPQSQAVLYIHDIVSMVVVCDWIKNGIMYDATGNIELWIRKRKRNVHFTLLSVLCSMYNYCRSIPWICFLKTKYVMAMCSLRWYHNPSKWWWILLGPWWLSCFYQLCWVNEIKIISFLYTISFS